jgi:hypothetical protein
MIIDILFALLDLDNLYDHLKMHQKVNVKFKLYNFLQDRVDR